MKIASSLIALVLVLGTVAVGLRHQLDAMKGARQGVSADPALAAGVAAAGASGPGLPAPSAITSAALSGASGAQALGRELGQSLQQGADRQLQGEGGDDKR